MSASMLGIVRSHDIDLALFVHVAGAMLLVGGLLTAGLAGIIGWRGEAATLRRFSVMTLLAVAVPGWIIMRIGAEWTYSKENLDSLSSDPTWLGIGFSLADGGGVLLLLALVLGGIGLRRSRQGKGDGLIKASGAIAAVLVVAYAVAVWAMGAKPS